MYLVPKPDYAGRRFISTKSQLDASRKLEPSHRQRIIQELKNLGVSKLALATTESHYLPSIIHENEHIGGVAYGYHPDGFAMLIATDLRVIFLDKKPLFSKEEELTYDVISGVSYGHVAFSSTITLHTRVRDYPIQTFNDTSARIFVEYIESRCLENQSDHRGKNYD